MADIRAKALGYYRDGHVHLLAVKTRKHEHRPYYVAGDVHGHTGTRVVVLENHHWRCSCKAVTDDGEPCAHVAAAQLATNWPSAAAKPERSKQ